jgi:cytoskeleton protein RodZ
MGELGERLRQAREAKGMTLEQIEEITKIRRRYLQALEEEDYGQLPGDVFVRGFLRNYALALGLDPEEILAASGHSVPSPIPPPMPIQHSEILDEPLVPPQSSQRVIAIAIGVMVLIALGLGGWTLYRHYGPGRGAQPTLPAPAPSPTSDRANATAVPGGVSTQTPSPTPSATPSPTATSEPIVGVLLRLEATAQTWLRVTADGRLAYEGMLDAGQVQEWRADEEILLRTGNAGGLRVWYNGQEEPPLGASGEVVERTWQAGLLPPDVGERQPTEVNTPGAVGPPPSTHTPTPTPPAEAPTVNP